MSTIYLIGAIALLLFIELSKRRRKEKGVQIEMIRARIKLQSNSPKEIERFLLQKEPYLTNDMIDQLINRIGELNADRTLNESWDTRYARIAPEDDEEVEETFEQHEIGK